MNLEIQERISAAEKLIAEAALSGPTRYNLFMAARSMRELLERDLTNPGLWATAVSGFERMRELYAVAGGTGDLALSVKPDASLTTFLELALSKAACGERDEALSMIKELVWARVDWEEAWQHGLEIARSMAAQAAPGRLKIAV